MSMSNPLEVAGTFRVAIGQAVRLGCPGNESVTDIDGPPGPSRACARSSAAHSGSRTWSSGKHAGRQSARRGYRDLQGAQPVARRRLLAELQPQGRIPSRTSTTDDSHRSAFVVAEIGLRRECRIVSWSISETHVGVQEKTRSFARSSSDEREPPLLESPVTGDFPVQVPRGTFSSSHRPKCLSRRLLGVP